MSNDDAVSLTCSVIGALGLTFSLRPTDRHPSGPRPFGARSRAPVAAAPARTSTFGGFQFCCSVSLVEAANR